MVEIKSNLETIKHSANQTDKKLCWAENTMKTTIAMSTPMSNTKLPASDEALVDSLISILSDQDSSIAQGYVAQWNRTHGLGLSLDDFRSLLPGRMTSDMASIVSMVSYTSSHSFH